MNEAWRSLSTEDFEPDELRRERERLIDSDVCDFGRVAKVASPRIARERAGDAQRSWVETLPSCAHLQHHGQCHHEPRCPRANAARSNLRRVPWHAAIPADRTGSYPWRRGPARQSRCPRRFRACGERWWQPPLGSIVTAEASSSPPCVRRSGARIVRQVRRGAVSQRAKRSDCRGAARYRRATAMTQRRPRVRVVDGE